MGVKVRVQRGKLYLDVYHNGVRKWEALHLSLTGDKRQDKELMKLAEVCRAKREAQLLAGEWDIKEKPNKVTLVKYLASCKGHYAGDRYITSVAHHVEMFDKGVLVSKVSRKWIMDFQDYLLGYVKANGEVLSQSSVSCYMGRLCSVLRLAMSEGILKSDPTSGALIVHRLEADMVFLSTEEVLQLAAVTPKTDYGKECRRAFLFACFTGLRISDIETLTWGMIEREPPQIIKRQHKTKTPVYVPLGKSALGLIDMDGEHDAGETVFNFMGRERKYSYSYLKHWTESAGVMKHIGWHTARRTFATLTLGRGADPVTVARLLGHTGLGQVMRYAKATDEMKRMAIDSLPELPTLS